MGIETTFFYNSFQEEMFFLTDQFSMLRIASDVSSVTSSIDTDTDELDYMDNISLGFESLRLNVPSFINLNDTFPTNTNLMRRIYSGDVLDIDDVEFLATRSAFYVLEYLDETSNIQITRYDTGMHRVLRSIFINNFFMCFYG